MAKIYKIELCWLCIRYRREKMSRYPKCLVYSVDGRPGKLNVRGEAVCPICRSGLQRESNRPAALVE